MNNSGNTLPYCLFMPHWGCNLNCFTCVVDLWVFSCAWHMQDEQPKILARALEVHNPAVVFWCCFWLTWNQHKAGGVQWISSVFKIRFWRYLMTGCDEWWYCLQLSSLAERPGCAHCIALKFGMKPVNLCVGQLDPGDNNSSIWSRGSAFYAYCLCPYSLSVFMDSSYYVPSSDETEVKWNNHKTILQFILKHSSVHPYKQSLNILLQCLNHFTASQCNRESN